ncbi:MAG TPA: protein kinase [Terriglobales bacterium]|nr:protein kinase [Terriglobales bacterium]
MIGEGLEHYTVLDKLGSGGMGVVYRARDQRLERDVAIKFLAPELLDARGSARFHREAQALAALNHPNIASIYALEEINSSAALVMELVEGPTLADRINAGNIPIEEALRIARQLAEALECAHERGIIHRDLKPSNIKLKQDGTVKVLDFGLARFLDAEDIEGRRQKDTGQRDPSTTASDLTSRPGIVVGTLAYMSPEQARGSKLDARCDIWAFGVVLYEMLTGRCAFKRASSSDTIAAVIKEEPDWSALPADIPPLVLHLLRRCLAKDPRDRLHASGDARLEIEEILSKRESADDSAAHLAKVAFRRRPLPWVLLALVLIATALLRWVPQRDQPGLKVSARYTINLPRDAPLAPASAMPLAVGRASLALSPDGASLVYVAFVDGNTQLYVRDMQRAEFRALPGTAGAHSPFFSPDGRWVGFFAHDKLMKVSLTGDQPIVLCGATLGFGGSWAADGQIYFSTDYSSGIFRVPETGGSPKTVTGNNWQFTPSIFPHVLPDNQGVLFSLPTFTLGVYDLRSRKASALLWSGTFPRFLPPGHILFARRGTLQAVPFDAQKLKLTGPPMQFLDGVRTERDGAAQFTFSADGTFIYASGSDGAVGSLVAVDRNGSRRSLQGPVGDFSAFRISPDGTRVVIPINTLTGTDIWLYDTARGTTTRLTSDERSSFPIWAPDGHTIYYVSWRSGIANLYRQSIDGGESVQVTHWAKGFKGSPLGVSRNGKWLLVMKLGDETREDLWILRLAEDDGSTAVSVEETPFLTSSFSECLGDLSPDGRWAAYTSDESGGWEVYVTSFPHAGEKIRISTNGGEEPLWSPDGRELFYRFGTRWFVTEVTTGDRFTASRPRLLFEGPFANVPGHSYSVAPDGSHFLLVEGVDQTKTLTELNVVTNIFDEVNRRMTSSQR